MRKNFIFTSVLLATGLCCGLTASAQTRIVKLTTSKPAGTEIKLLVNHSYEGVTVDWGDGNVQTYNTGREAFREVNGQVKGSTITITGDDTWDMLSCAGCGISGIDLTGAEGMKSLFLQDNELKELDIRQMQSVTDLDISNNQISKIIATADGYWERDLPVIETANFANNQLEGAFALRTATLRNLDITNNAFTSLYVTYNPNLDVLLFGNNKLKGVNLSRCTALTTVVCDNNELSTLTMPTNMTTLRQFVCDNNLLGTKKTNFDFSRCEQLVDLSCTGNQISELYIPNGASFQMDNYNVAGNKLSFNSLPRRRPTYFTFGEQGMIDISGYTNMKSKDGVPYMPVVTWAERQNAPLDLSKLRNYAVGPDGTSSYNMALYTWYAEDNDGNITELEKGTTSTSPKDYYANVGKFSFFTPQGRVFARLNANSTCPYKNDDIYVETTRISIGEDMTTGIKDVVTDNESGLQISASAGTLRMYAPQAVKVLVFSADGKQVWNGTVESDVSVNLPSGIYIVNGKKVAL